MSLGGSQLLLCSPSLPSPAAMCPCTPQHPAFHIPRTSHSSSVRKLWYTKARGLHDTCSTRPRHSSCRGQTVQNVAGSSGSMLSSPGK